jgi:hypothetical protein
MTNKKVLNEIKLSWAGKLFFAGAAAYLARKFIKGYMGEGEGGTDMSVAKNIPKMPLKVRGTPEQIKALKDTIAASKEFQEEIGKPGATIEDVIEKLKLRNETKQQFEQITGYPWPL